MRKLASIFLLACLIGPFLGSYIWVELKRSKIKKEVKWKMIAGIDKKELVFMTFSIKDSQEKLNWKHSKEFEYKGQWYDIVDQEIVGDSIRYHLWWDHEETQLNKQLQELITYTLDQNPINKENKSSIAKLFKSLYFKEKQTNKNLCYDLYDANYLCYKYSLYQFDFFDISPPPPKFF